MFRNRPAAALLGLCTGLAACDRTSPADVTEPDAAAPAPAFSSTTAADAAAGYTRTLLTTRNGIAQGINNKGQVVGFYDAGANTHAFVWEKGVLTDLGTLGGDISDATAINNTGQIVGSAANTDNEIHAVLWQNGVIRDLGDLGVVGPIGSAESEATAINTDGQVVGWSFTPSFNIRAFIWADGKMKRLQGLETTYGKAFGIDNVGRIVGEFGSERGPHAFRWTNGVNQALGSLGGRTSTAKAVNAGGRVVGWSETSSGATHAFLWRNGDMTDLGTLGGSSSGAYAINGLGQIVGESGIANDASTHAFIWQNGVMSDVGRGMARGINLNGWIVGAAVVNGSFVPAVWKPADGEPPPPPPPPPPGQDAAVRLGSIFFTSVRNGTTNPAVDTVGVGRSVTWTWLSRLGRPHSVKSTGSPSFPSSEVLSGPGTTYKVTFTKAGTYEYTCLLHPGKMTGRIVVK
jgi:probable HAF family extracellular repeat protein